MSVPGVSPLAAVQAYQASASGVPAGGANFGSVLTQALQNGLQAGHAADAKAVAAIAGDGNITDVVAAVSKAELALQTTVTIRDRVVQAYQDIMRMPI